MGASMAENNVLIALAYLQETDNPLSVFCIYVEYCLSKSSSKELSNYELKDSLKSNFGLKLPQHIIKLCIKILTSDLIIETINSGVGYRLIANSFDMQIFESKRDNLQQKEDLLVNNMKEFVKDSFEVQWNTDMAKEAITLFFTKNENAAELFMNGKSTEIDEDKFGIDSWLVGKYVEHILAEKNSYFDYLLEVIKGLMIYIGLHLAEPNGEIAGKRLNKTPIYFDTRLTLRVLGYSWEAETTAAKEILDLLKNIYKASICIFDHTLGEIKHALEVAKTDLEKKGYISDDELDFFSYKNNFSASDFRIATQTVEDDLKSLGISIVKINFDIRQFEYGLDWRALTAFIQKKHIYWKLGAIDNDIKSIQEINNLRKGNYSIDFGGKNKLPIFVTTNSALVRCIKDFTITSQQNGSEDDLVIYNQPIITDYSLMCRLWLPIAKEQEALPILVLARNAHATIQDATFFSRLLKKATDLKAKHPNIKIKSIPIFAREKFEELVIKKTQGNPDKLDEEMIANTFEEVVAMQTHLIKKNLQLAEKERDALKTEVINQGLLVGRTKILLINRLIIYSSNFWYLYLFLILNMINFMIPRYTINLSITFFICTVFAILEKFYWKNEFITNRLKKIIIPWFWKKYIIRVQISLSTVQRNYLSEILEECKTKIRILSDNYDYLNIS